WTQRISCLGSAGPDYVYRLIGNVSTCNYSDDFNNDFLTWIELRPIVTETAGNLNITPGPNKRKAAAASDLLFAGCQICTNDFQGVQFTGGVFARTFLNSHFVDKRNTLQLIIKENLDRAVLKFKVGGATVDKAKALFTFDPNTPYDISISYDGTTVTVSVNGSTLITMTHTSNILSGIVTVESKLQTTTMDSFCSN
ncbi:hypothetical protein L0244_26645, partial [bacterium]|nr:hypothetical protein [bacterium]